MKVRSTAGRHEIVRADASLLEEILAGLESRPKRLHPKFLYDARGSALFDRICELPEYYLTRAETKILQARAPALMRSLGPGCAIVELGSGSSRKTRILLDALDGCLTYVPVEISRAHLMTAARVLKQSYFPLEVLPLCADFTRPFALPAGLERQRRLVFFPGSTIGNFYRDEALDLLRSMRSLAGEKGVVLIGVDLRKGSRERNRRIIEPAYNDAAGITAAFNLNLLTRLNREFGADFELAAFEHRALWIEEESRIEMHLVSRRAQTVRMGDSTIELAAGEFIWTESCHKYECEQFAALAADAGLRVDDAWIDNDSLFSVQVLRY